MGPLQLFFGFLGTVSRHYFAPHTPRGLSAGGAGDSELDTVAARLEQAHDLLVRALESVEKG